VNDLWLEHRPIQLTIEGVTDPGRLRSENQDHFLVADLGASTQESGVVITPANLQGSSRPNGQIDLGPKGVLLIVADGMGGAAAGSIASKMCTSWIHEELVERWGTNHGTSPDQFMTSLRDSVTITNYMIHQQSTRYPQYHGMGTTVTAAGVLQGILYLAQVGDSRAYLIRGGAATQLTRDQSLVQELIDAGTMTEEDAEKSQHRSVILQAIGVAPEVKVDLTYQQLRKDDVILLCSDGLTRLVRREEIARAIDEIPRPAELCNYLVNLANERGGPDNITVLVCKVNGDGLESPMLDDVVARRGYTLSPD
jgi:PPM family protein phosphatase